MNRLHWRLSNQCPVFAAMLLLRKLHLYLGTLFAPAIIFFAFSGILQVLGLHEAEDPHATQPPHWIVLLASVHKDQRPPRPKPLAAPGAPGHTHGEQAHEHADAAPGADAADGTTGKAAPDAATGKAGSGAAKGTASSDATNWSRTLLKAFAVLMALGLIASAVIGVVIAFKNPRTRRTALAMVVIGLVLPLALLAL